MSLREMVEKHNIPIWEKVDGKWVKRFLKKNMKRKTCKHCNKIYLANLDGTHIHKCIDKLPQFVKSVYTYEKYFELPLGLDLNDENIKSYQVIYGLLEIVFKDGTKRRITGKTEYGTGKYADDEYILGEEEAKYVAATYFGYDD
jgi:hypothetical protein